MQSFTLSMEENIQVPTLFNESQWWPKIFYILQKPEFYTIHDQECYSAWLNNLQWTEPLLRPQSIFIYFFPLGNSDGRGASVGVVWRTITVTSFHCCHENGCQPMFGAFSRNDPSSEVFPNHPEEREVAWCLVLIFRGGFCNRANLRRF